MDEPQPKIEKELLALEKALLNNVQQLANLRQEKKIMEEKKRTLENIKNSIYLHPILSGSLHEKALSEALPKGNSFIRFSSSVHLTLVTAKENSSSYIRKPINVFFNVLDTKVLTAIYLNQGPVFDNLVELSKKQNLVLNLVKEIALTSEQARQLKEEKKTFKNILNKINEGKLFNNSDFYAQYIGKNDKIEFPKILGIQGLSDYFFLITFQDERQDETTALISKNQLLVSLVYDVKPQEKKSIPIPEINSITQLTSQTLFSPPKPEAGSEKTVSASQSQKTSVKKPKSKHEGQSDLMSQPFIRPTNGNPESENSDSDPESEFASQSQRNILPQKTKNDLAYQSSQILLSPPPPEREEGNKRKADGTDLNKKPAQRPKTENGSQEQPSTNPSFTGSSSQF